METPPSSAAPSTNHPSMHMNTKKPAGAQTRAGEESIEPDKAKVNRQQKKAKGKRAKFKRQEKNAKVKMQEAVAETARLAIKISFSSGPKISEAYDFITKNSSF